MYIERCIEELIDDLKTGTLGAEPELRDRLEREIRQVKRATDGGIILSEEAAAESRAVVTRKRPRRGKIRLFAIQTPTVPGRARQDYFIEEKGERVLVGRSIGILGDEFVYSNDDVHRSEEILVQVRLQLTQLHFTHQIPVYADDPVLVRWLFARFGFGGGGGANAMKTETFRKLLLDPAMLSTEILRHRWRMAERADEENGLTIENATEALATSIRLRGM